MTQDEKNRLQYQISVMQAYKDGAEIECNGSGDWTLCNLPSPQWNWGVCDYRIKPEPPKPKYRPFESAEEVLNAIKEHGGYVKDITRTDVVVYRYLKKFAAIEDTNKGRKRNNYFISAVADHENGFREGYMEGAELGYKEAITQAKEWLKEQGKDWWEGYGLPFSITDFEAYMNKLLEEKNEKDN